MDAGVLDAGSSFHFSNVQDITSEENFLITRINSNGSDYFTDGKSNQARGDLDNESFTELDDNHLSLSFGSYNNGSRRSLTPNGSSELMDFQISDWQDHLGSLNTSDDEYDVVDVGEGGILLDVHSGTSRRRFFSTSSLTGPCIPPDLIMESRDSEDFLNDSFNDLDDVQQQIYLEDIHRNLVADDMLAPLDDCMDGASLQKELIDKLTGMSNPPSLAFDNNVGVTEGIESSSQRVNDEVSVNGHISLVISTQNVKGRGCPSCNQLTKVTKLKKKVRFDLKKSESELISKDNFCEGRKGTPCQLRRFLQTLASFGIGKKAIIRRCGDLDAKGHNSSGLRSTHTLTRLHLPSKVKMVNATPGSENVSIDGMEVSLPAGSIVLAVVNESGSLVPYSVDPNTFHDERLKLNPEVNYCLPAALQQDIGIKPAQRSDSAGNLIVYSPTELINHLDVTPNLKDTGTTFKSNNKNNLVSVAEAAQTIKKKLNFETNEKCDDIVDVETVSHSTPVLEACDLATLLYEFEASESVNRRINEANNDAAFYKDLTSKHQNIKIEKGISTECYSTTDSHSLHPILAKALEKVTKCSSNQTRSSITITSTRPTVGGSSSTTTTSISIKVKKVDGKKPAKSLIERKNELMKKKLVAHQRIKDALPIEIIEKIRASGARKTTKILTEALLPKFLKKRKYQLPKTKPSKRLKKNEKKVPEVQNFQCDDNSFVASVNSVFQEHDYCQRPINIKTEIKSEFDLDTMSSQSELQKCHVYNKLPDYCKSEVFVSEDKDTKLIASPEIINDSNSTEDMSQVNVQNTKEIGSSHSADSTSVYSRLPDYVTGITNADSKFEVVGSEQNLKETPLKNPNDLQPSEKPKKKLKLSEYRMRIRSTDNSRSSSPSILDERAIKGIKPELSNFTSTNVKPNVVPPCVNSTPLGVVAIDDSLEGKDNVYPTTTTHFGVVPADDDCHLLEEKHSITTTTQLIAPDKENESIPKTTKDVIKVKRVSSIKPSKSRAQCVPTSNNENDKSLSENSSHVLQGNNKQGLVSSRKNYSKNANVIEIDLEEGELDENDGEDKIESVNKLALLSMLPLSKMPPTSLGHSLLYSKKQKNKQTVEEANVKTMQKVPSSSMSNSSITSSGSSLSPHRHKTRTRRRDRSHSSSTSRSRSHSKKRSYRRSQSPKKSHLSSHRKSLRRWTRSRSRSSHRRSRSRSSHRRSRSRSHSSHRRSRSRSSHRRSRSRSSHRRSRSYSSSSVRSYSSRSSSSSKSYSTRPRSRSRSKISRRKTRHSRRHRRSKDRYHSSSRSRSYCYEDRRKSSREYRNRSDWSYGSSRQPHMYTKHMSQYRSLTDVERDVEERKIVYCGCLEEGTSRTDLKRKFEKFGPIVDSNIHFRENGDNYGFVTFLYSESAFQALENGKNDPLLSKYNLCFGGRRKFCKERYCDLDAQKDDYDYYNSSASMDYDTLLQTALNRHR